ncbi:phytanoyl-CoA dioxygenase family protein [Rhizobium leguminosarum]|uniref:phytanoyl-CoA dioxygenase family protein n=1 Tax=Rhizobium leguminosarum TaxID=384 RepID=UPI00144133DF|nr:phytanoyl-CoA dioxygenase family protein [Rhizobium leguminosarum]MBY5868965.1 phytanoyl-CoA dioxygenase [Rhizobium leguminosarum]NKM04708.1 phytanoyl-CoA dioxygenase [Rhizobium leguminosarum bv. viciae]
MTSDVYPAALSAAQIEQFIEDGFVRIDDAFPRALAKEARAIMWRDIPFDADDPRTWTQPVVRLAGYGGGPFEKAVNTPVLHSAFDQLVGKGRWEPRSGLGSFPVRFPHPDDAGWHVDLSFPGEDSDPNEQRDFSAWRVNITSRGRALLMLFLFSDVGEEDAPTRIRVGSHKDIARLLAPAGEAGMAHLWLEHVGEERPLALATGRAGTVYLCHPFLIHTAQMHRGKEPRFMAQPGLAPSEPIRLEREDCAYSPVETAIRRALHDHSI